jgi:hypothetical protein
MNFSSTTGRKPISEKCVVFYDPSNGAIRYTHRVITMEGATEKSAEEIEERAMHLAKQFGLQTDRLHALHVDAYVFRPGRRYSVDPTHRKILEHEAVRK